MSLMPPYPGSLPVSVVDGDASTPTALEPLNAALLRQRFATMPQDRVEGILRSHHLPSDPRSLLDRLERPDARGTPATMAQRILEELTDVVEDFAMMAAGVWRYVELRQLWHTHPDPALRTGTAFMKSIGPDHIIRIVFVVGTSTIEARQASLSAIRRTWGPDFWHRIPLDIRPAGSGSDDLSKRMLKGMQSACRRGRSLPEAVDEWKQAIARRLHPDVAPSSSCRRSRSPLLQTGDVHSANAAVVLGPLLPASAPTAAPVGRSPLPDLPGTPSGRPRTKRSRPSHPQGEPAPRGAKRPKVHVRTHLPATPEPGEPARRRPGGDPANGVLCEAPRFARIMVGVLLEHLSLIEPEWVCDECAADADQWATFWSQHRASLMTRQHAPEHARRSASHASHVTVTETSIGGGSSPLSVDQGLASESGWGCRVTELESNGSPFVPSTPADHPELSGWSPLDEEELEG